MCVVCFQICDVCVVWLLLSFLFACVNLWCIAGFSCVFGFVVDFDLGVF